MARSIDTISGIESKTTACLTTSHTKDILLLYHRRMPEEYIALVSPNALKKKLLAFALHGKAARTTQQRAGVHQSQIRLDCAQEFVQQSW
jgi:hypothetical protein